MTKDDLFKHYIGIIPYRDKDVASYESYAAYARAFLEAAERNFSKRCLQTVRAIASWRETARYDGKTQVSMLDKLQFVLAHARNRAIYSADLSKVAVTAAPINTA